MDSFKKLDPRLMVKTPVMFVTMVGAAVTTAEIFTTAADRGFIAQIALWLGSPSCSPTSPKPWPRAAAKPRPQPCAKPASETRPADSRERQIEEISAAELRKDDVVVVRAGEMIPADGDVIEGAATVDESAITGESAPSSAKAAATAAPSPAAPASSSDQIKVRVSVNPGEGFLDRMIALVEGAHARRPQRNRADHSALRRSR